MESSWLIGMLHSGAALALVLGYHFYYHAFFVEYYHLGLGLKCGGSHVDKANQPKSKQVASIRQAQNRICDECCEAATVRKCSGRIR